MSTQYCQAKTKAGKPCKAVAVKRVVAHFMRIRRGQRGSDV